MNCVVTAGPTYESLDNVRRLTNFSTGRLGTELANYLVKRRHDVTLLIGQQATWSGEQRAQRIEAFSTTADLAARLENLSKGPVDAVFHAAAVSDYTFGKVWLRSESGEMTEMKSGKISTRSGTLLAELVPTPKIIASLRDWYPEARLVGWKYEVDGDRAGVIKLGVRQMTECRTDACVVNGKAYGLGFGLVTGQGTGHGVSVGACEDFRDPQALFDALERLLTGRLPDHTSPPDDEDEDEGENPHGFSGNLII